MIRQDRGILADPLFVGATRPAMRWGVTYSALLFNLVFTMEVFLVTKNLLTLLLSLPIHGVCMLLCARDARFFDLVLLWGRRRLVWKIEPQPAAYPVKGWPVPHRRR
jgi:type IV secretion system protein VirB3